MVPAVAPGRGLVLHGIRDVKEPMTHRGTIIIGISERSISPIGVIGSGTDRRDDT
jgi:hypothetical protein